jgi:hypothetical protein
MPSRRYEALASHVRFRSLADIPQRGLQNSFTARLALPPRKKVCNSQNGSSLASFGSLIGFL